MSGSLPWSSTTSPPPSTNDPNELLRRIEQNTAQTLQWVKYVVYVLVVLVIATVVLLI
jgi:hypothetical protein